MSVWTIVTVVTKALALTSWPQSSPKNSASVIQDGLGNAATEVRKYYDTNACYYLSIHVNNMKILQQVPSLMLVLIQLSTPSEDS